jgi:Transposase zinc-binding domain
LTRLGSPLASNAVYRPRDAEHGVLHAVVRKHPETFLREAAQRADGAGLPQFVEQEFREFLACGVLAHGFVRLRCDTCAEERWFPFLQGARLLFELRQPALQPPPAESGSLLANVLA